VTEKTFKRKFSYLKLRLFSQNAQVYTYLTVNDVAIVAGTFLSFALPAFPSHSCRVVDGRIGARQNGGSDLNWGVRLSSVRQPAPKPSPRYRHAKEKGIRPSSHPKHSELELL